MKTFGLFVLMFSFSLNAVSAEKSDDVIALDSLTQFKLKLTGQKFLINGSDGKSQSLILSNDNRIECQIHPVLINGEVIDDKSRVVYLGNMNLWKTIDQHGLAVGLRDFIVRLKSTNPEGNQISLQCSLVEFFVGTDEQKRKCSESGGHLITKTIKLNKVVERCATDGSLKLSDVKNLLKSKGIDLQDIAPSVTVPSAPGSDDKMDKKHQKGLSETTI